MSPDESALIRAICETPGDDLPRLVYADWLEERGDPDRAEFIRVQCEAAGLVTFDERHNALRRRARELFEAHGQRWLADDWPEADPGQPLDGLLFDRGFFSRVSMADRGLTGPQVEGMTRTRAKLALLRTWDLSGNDLGVIGLRAIAACPRLAGLERLLVRNCRLDDDGLEVLAASPHLGSLVELAMTCEAEVPYEAHSYTEPDPPTTVAVFDDERAMRIEQLFRRHGKRVTIPR